MTLSARRSALAFALALAGAVPAVAETAAPAPAPAPAAAPAPADAASATAPEKAPETLPDIALGSETAPVTIVEYASFTCSHCRDFHDENLPKLKAEYIDTGKVRFIQREVYFDQYGLWAGIIARCGGDMKYYAISDLLFAQQKTWTAAKTEAEFAANLRTVGKSAGLNDAQMDACWADEAKVKRMLATFQKHATTDKIEGTPVFFINGEMVPNQAWDKFKAKIDEKLTEAGATAPTKG